MVTSVGGKKRCKGGDGNPEKGLCTGEEARCPGRSGSWAEGGPSPLVGVTAADVH